MIYCVPPSLAKQCLEELDFREKGGYAREIITVVEDGTGNQVQALLYRGTPDNPAFSARLTTDLRYAAAVMAVAHGPSGPNHVYLHQLYEFLMHAKQQLQHQHRTVANEVDSADVIEDDTYFLADMTTALQQHGLYYFCGAGSNQHGQLINYFDEDQDFASLTESFIAVAADANLPGDTMDKPKRLFCGGGHSGLLTERGNLYLWGWNQHGQCGTNDTKQTAVKVGGTETSSSQQASSIPLMQSLSIKVETASFGFSHTLIIEKETGRLYAFGDDSHGQVTGRDASQQNDGSSISNDSTCFDVFTPIVPSVVDKDESFAAVGAGLFHSAAITSKGELVTFGESKYGQAIMKGHRWKPPDSVKLVDVVCGRHHTAMLDDQGRVWTMGENKLGQLGRQRENNAAKLQRRNVDPVPQLIDGTFGKDQLSISANQDASRPIYRCVELQSGWSHVAARVEVQQDPSTVTTTEIYGWGRSDKGQLGLQERLIATPTRLHLGRHAMDHETSPVVALACGSDSTHFLVTKNESESQIFSVGWNEHGNLGTGSKDEEDILEPREVPGVSKIVSPASYSTYPSNNILLAAGGAHMLALRL